jgi:hypothetical protein
MEQNGSLAVKTSSVEDALKVIANHHSTIYDGFLLKISFQ